MILCGAREPQIVSDVSDPKVSINYSFHGASEMIFGAIIYPDGQTPTGPIDMAVVLRGPSQSIIVREKQKLGGIIWANVYDTRFRSAPGFYSIASTRPLDKIIDPVNADIYELGVHELQLSPASGMTPTDQLRFENGLIDLREKATLYVNRAGAVTISNGVLFRAQLDIPARAPVGHYTAEAYLIRKGHVIAATSRDISLQKFGFERFVTGAAQNDPLYYGLTVVILAIALGYGAGALFRNT
ncbi:MAG: TIGR02186 family protein [Alphaproteobacteria bacterium]|nr:TIGR02186 family protein [Alphaproteobacteria bacterium]